MNGDILSPNLDFKRYGCITATIEINTRPEL